MVSASRADGHHWVGDLAVEADAEVLGDTGELLLTVVEGGWHHTCRIDVATGVATLSIGAGAARAGEATNLESFTPPTEGAAKNADATRRTGQTTIRGPGRYRVRLANCDDELTLWVDDVAVSFDAPATFDHPRCRPVWTVNEPFDLAPAGVGSDNLAVRFHALRMFRDVYYIAIDSPYMIMADYRNEAVPALYAQADGRPSLKPWMLVDAFQNPQRWATDPLFAPETRRVVTLDVPEGHYFPMGDNSSHSSDARIWEAKTPDRALPERLLIGKATCVIWPHMTVGPGEFRYTPNLPKMRRIR